MNNSKNFINFFKGIDSATVAGFKINTEVLSAQEFVNKK